VKRSKALVCTFPPKNTLLDQVASGGEEAKARTQTDGELLFGEPKGQHSARTFDSVS